MHPDLVAHVKWFADPKDFPTQYGLLLSLPLLAAYAVAAGAIVVAFVIQRRFPEPTIVKLLERFSSTGPLVLGLHLGLALVAAAVIGLLFVPSLRPDDDLYGRAIIVVEAMCGVMILLGLATRAAAILLALLGVVAMQPFTFESILENIHILGIAVFLFIVGRGPYLARSAPRGEAADRPRSGARGGTHPPAGRARLRDRLWRAHREAPEPRPRAVPAGQDAVPESRAVVRPR